MVNFQKIKIYGILSKQNVYALVNEHILNDSG